MSRQFLMIASVAGFLAVALGAFGAHGLEAYLSEDQLAVYKTAVQYQMFHVVALMVVGLLCREQPNSAALKYSGYCFMWGIVLFSGSLYALSITGVRILGIITPLGGVVFLLAWSLLFYSIFKQARATS